MWTPTVLLLGWASAAQAQTLSLSGPCPGPVSVTLEGATERSSVALVRGSGLGDGVVPSGACEGLELGLASPAFVHRTRTDGDGDAFLAAELRRGCDDLFAAIDLATCTPSEPVEIIPLSAAVGEMPLAERADAVVHGREAYASLGVGVAWYDGDGDGALDLVWGSTRMADGVGGIGVQPLPLPRVTTSRGTLARLVGGGDVERCGTDVTAVGPVNGQDLLSIDCDVDRDPVLYLLAPPLPAGDHAIEDVEHVARLAGDGYSLKSSRAAELTGDDIADVVVSAETGAGSYEVYVASGLELVGDRHVPDIVRKIESEERDFGERITVADWTGDGVHDVAASGEFSGVVHVLPGPIPEGVHVADDLEAGSIDGEYGLFDLFGYASDAGERE